MSDPEPRFLQARWVHLAMLNYEIDPALLAPLVPAGTELDSWRGRTFVSVVGFQFLRTRVLGIRIPFHVDFDEVNLRFYVRRAGPDGMRRGVVFVKEIVPRAAIAWVANRVYRESYVALPMRHFDRLSPDAGGQLVYEWQLRGRWSRLSVHTQGAALLPRDDSEESFITEHYWGYSGRTGGPTLEYQVEHPRWRVWRGVRAELDVDVGALYGERFRAALARSPSSSFVAEGSDVIVRRGRPIA